MAVETHMAGIHSPSRLCLNPARGVSARQGSLKLTSIRTTPLGGSPLMRSVRQLTVFSLPDELNPQNVPDIKTPPSLSMSAEDAVRVQLDALCRIHDPWLNHGIQTAYEFAFDAGGMERSRYFGFSKDLYHFDHFLGQLQNAYPELTRGEFTYSLESTSVDAEGRTEIVVKVTDQSKDPSRFVFTMEQYPYGRKKGCFLTKSLLRGTV